MESTPAPRSPDGDALWPDRRRTRRFVALAVLAAVVLAFAWFIWPTPYRYGRDADRHRVHRLTGQAQVYDARKETWRPARRGGSNDGGTRAGGSGSGSPIGGSRSEGRGSGRGGDQWWHEDAPSRSRNQSRGDQWWYQDGKATQRDPEESPIGGSRKPAQKGSPIGGQ